MPRQSGNNSAARFAAAPDTLASSPPLWRRGESWADRPGKQRERAGSPGRRIVAMPAESRTSIDLDADRSDNAAPLVDLAGNEAAKFPRGHGERVEPHLHQPCFELGLIQTCGDICVIGIDDGVRHTRRTHQSEDRKSVV